MTRVSLWAVQRHLATFAWPGGQVVSAQTEETAETVFTAAGAPGHLPGEWPGAGTNASVRAGGGDVEGTITVQVGSTIVEALICSDPPRNFSSPRAKLAIFRIEPSRRFRKIAQGIWPAGADGGPEPVPLWRSPECGTILAQYTTDLRDQEWP